MKLPAALVLLMLVVMGTIPARALLGDDFQTVAARYGKPVHALTRPDGSQPLIYDCEGFRIVVDFEDGRSVSEAFSRPRTLSPFPKETLQAFLDVHSAGRRWRETERIPGQRGWQRDGALALYDERSFRPTLIISSIHYTPVEATASRVLATSPAPEADPSALEADSGPQSLTLGSLDTGHLDAGHLDTGHLDTGHLDIGSLQTGGLQIGKLGDRSPVR